MGGDDLLAKLEEALMGKAAGDRVLLQLEPEDAFGDFNDQLMFLEPRNLFPAELEEGMAFEGLPPGSSPNAPSDLLYFVSEIYPEHVVMDTPSHPLVSIALRLDLKVHAVRDAPRWRKLGWARWAPRRRNCTCRLTIKGTHTRTAMTMVTQAIYCIKEIGTAPVNCSTVCC